MSRSSHPSFWLDLAGKLGPPVFAGTLVACLLAGRFEALHGVLMALGLSLIALSHWDAHHRGSHHRGSHHRGGREGGA